jgi:hypothetical protein
LLLKKFQIYTSLIVLVFLIEIGVTQVNDDYIYYLNIVHHSDDQLCEHLPPITTFTAYLNHDQSKILIENAPRWQEGADPNINGNGGFGVELGNFINPAIQVGDSVFIRFTCNETGEQGTLADSITSIPWVRFLGHLYLEPKDLPLPPQNLQINIIENISNTISWEHQQGMTYSVYRRILSDTLSNGKTRNLYYRVADGLTDANYLDTDINEGEYYGYILYALSSEGVISSHSREILNIDGINNFSVSPRATTVNLQWDAYQSSFGDVMGYNIYRHGESEHYVQPEAYCGQDTFYIDSRLETGRKYYYKIVARLADESEVGDSEEIGVTTLSSTNGFYSYANLKTAVVIYTNTNRGSITSSSIPKIKTMLNESKLFYWRNSGMKLNVQLFYHVIDEYEEFGDPEDTWASMLKTVNDLKEKGVMNTQYDIIYRITPAVNGFWSYGVQYLDLPGPFRQTGFSHSTWPTGTGVMYQGQLPDGIDKGSTWIFVHEVQHAIDALYNANEHSEMYHGDQPSKFPVACGEHFDFQAKMFRTFNAYEDLLSNWGDIYEAVDADNDGFPDDDPLVALDEARFNSNPGLPDSDDDGYSDRQEALDGVYGGSNPMVQDSDADGIIDGEDEHPRYPVDTSIKYFTPVIDGVIEDAWPLVNDSVVYSQDDIIPLLYLSYDDNFLYLALRLEQYALPELTFDFHSDGWWHSSGNTIMKINPDNGTFSVFHSWDASQEVRDYSEYGDGMWDDDTRYQAHFNRRVIYPDSVNLKVNYIEPPIMEIEISIPKRNYAGITLQPGDEFGLNIRYLNINHVSSQWAVTFDSYDFVNFILGDYTPISIKQETVVNNFLLSQNYPNPFNPSTVINYQVGAIHESPVFVELIVYNSLGQKVRTLVNERQPAGVYQVNFEAFGLASGVYYYQIKAGNFTQARKMLLIR